jgi:hypothetical protein
MIRVRERRVIAPGAPEGAFVVATALAPDGERVAYAVAGTAEAGLYVASTNAPQGGLLLVATGDLWATELAFSPDGDLVGYVLIDPNVEPSAPVGVAWAASGASGERGRTPGMSYAWTPKGKALLVADPAAREVARVDVTTGKRTTLSALLDDGDPQFAPKLAVSPDGTRFVVTCRRVEEDLGEVWLVSRKEKGGVDASLFTEVPSASAVTSPFWSPRGVTLGLFITHGAQEKTALIVVPRLEGEGEIVYEAERLDPVVAPAWAPSGDAIAILRAEPGARPRESGPARLVVLRLERGEVKAIEPLSQPGELDGRLRFLDDRTIAVDGAATAFLLTLSEAL